MPDVFIDTDTPEKTSHETSVSSRSAASSKNVKRHKIKIFEAFSDHPTGVGFQHQEEDEEIFLFLRAHHITNIPWIIITLLLIIAPIVIVPFLSIITPFSFEIPPLTLLCFLLFYLLMVFAYAFVNFIHWFYNIGIVTNKNIVDLDYAQIVQVHVSTTNVSQIEDVSYTQSGFLRTLFNFGDIHIQTAGQAPNFEFTQVPKPGEAVFVIQKLIGH